MGGGASSVGMCTLHSATELGYFGQASGWDKHVGGRRSISAAEVAGFEVSLREETYTGDTGDTCLLFRSSSGD